MTTNIRKAQLQADFRKRHPERAKLVMQIQSARVVAAMRVAYNHQEEYEREILKECRERGIPRFPPPLPKEEDARVVRRFTG